MVHKKSELSANSTIDSLLPPVPSVPQILQENLKYEQEMKKKEKLNKKNRKKNRNTSVTSTKFLPDWINDVTCEWAHSHDFRNYAKNPVPQQKQAQNKPHRRKSSVFAKNRVKLTDKHSEPNDKTKLIPSETSPLYESPAKSPEERAQHMHDTLTDNELIEYDIAPQHSDGNRSRSVSKESIHSCDSLQSSDIIEPPLPIAIHPDLQKEVSRHLEKFNDNQIQKARHTKVGSDSTMLASELKKRYKTKIKEVGKSMTAGNIDDITHSGTDAHAQHKKQSKRSSRRWRRRRRHKNIGSRVIDEDHEIDNNYFPNNNDILTTPSSHNSMILTTPSRDYSLSTSPDMQPKVIKSDDEKTLQHIQNTSVHQPKKAKYSGGMLSRLFSKFQTWTDKNRQAFTSYSQILKTAVTQQEALIKQYQTELHNCKKQMSSELKRWKRWAQIEAENMARTYYENKYLLLSSQIEISMAKLLILQNIVNKVQFVLDGGDMERVKDVIFEPVMHMDNDDYLYHLKTRSLPVSPFASPASLNSLQKRMNRSFSNLPVITSPTLSGTTTGIMEGSEDSACTSDQMSMEYIFRNPNMLCLETSVAALQEALPTLMDVESKLRVQYESLIKKIMVQQSPSERANLYRKMLFAGFKCKYLIRSQNYHYHPPDDRGLQVEFNCLLIDDRYCEGKLLRKWRKDIQRKHKDKREACASADDVSDFLQDLTSLILREYPIYQRDDWDPTSLDDKDATDLSDIAGMHAYGMKYVNTYYVLKLYLDRLVFPRLSFNLSHDKVPIWLSLYSDEEKAFDTEFAQNCEWMRNLSQSQLSIPMEYQKRYATNKQISAQFNSILAMKNNMIHPELPYYYAILSFNKAKNVHVPHDELYCFIEGLRLINSAASHYKYNNDVMQYYASNNALDAIDEQRQMDAYDSSPIKKENVQLSADDLFPILVWIMVHCRINDIYMRLGYLQKFLDESIKYFGEVGMCLSLVQAAAVYIRKKEGWHFGLDQELDKNTLNLAKHKNSNDSDEIVI